MDMEVFYIKLIIILLGVYVHAGFGQKCRNEPKCSYTRVKGMEAADCYDKGFRQFPKCISKDVEIIDLTLNRIRKITKDDFIRYAYLKILYLQDNTIQVIDEDVFTEATKLQTLDLSLNTLSDISPLVFHLPSLRTLYLGQNWNMNIADIIEKSKPITSPLTHLDISRIFIEESSELPDLGIMPYLVKYNISGNKLSTISTKYFAGLCALQILDTSNVTIDYENSCECWTLNNWLTQRHVRFTAFDCQANKKDCVIDIPEDDLKTYETCQGKLQEMVKHSKMMKIFIPIGIVLIIVIIILIYCIFRRKSRNKKKAKTAHPLLNVNSK